MKKIAKITGVMLALIIALSSFAIMVSAASEKDLTISINGDVAVVTGYKSSATGTVDIPSTYNGVAVTRIYDKAFKDCTKITEVNIPSSIERVGSNAFQNCAALKTVNFAGSSVTFGTSVFNDCTVLESVTLPSALKTIPEKTFYACTSLSDAKIPSTVTTIETEAFANCRSLEVIEIPASVTNIEKNAFISCDSVAEFKVASGNTVYNSSNGALYGPYESGDSRKALVQYPNAKTQTSYTVASGTKVISDFAFGNNAYLTEITLPSGLETIDSYAFYSCTKLSNISIPSTVTSLGSQSFGRCTSLKSITIPSSVRNIESAFYKSGLENVVIENGLTTIGIKAFEDCVNLKTVTIPSSVKTIAVGAFYGCSSLGNLSVPSTVTTIKNGVFTGCENVTLYVDENSAAHTYALNNSIPYKLNVTVSQLPDKISYNYKDTLDLTGLKLNVNYTDGTSETVTSGFEATPMKLTKTGTQTVTVNYEGYTATFSVDVSYSLIQWIIMIFLLGFLWY